MIEYRSIADLSAVILRNLRCIPRDIDVVVGVPRSGLLAANILALQLNLPLTDVEGLVAGRLLGGGNRIENREGDLDGSRGLNVLVLDDSVDSGSQIARVRQRLQGTSASHKIVYGAVFGSPEGSHFVDFCLETLPRNRVFEWNLMHSWVMARSCVDIDGVLCRDPSEEENDDGPRYIEFLNSAEPVIVPTVPIGWLVTCRLEKYRRYTEEWLKRHGVVYGNLVMMDFPTKAARLSSGSHGKYKAHVYSQTGAELFVESSASQSQEIAFRSGKQVFCLETGRMELPSAFPLTTDACRSRILQGLRKVRVAARKVVSIPRYWRRAFFGK